MVPAHHVTPGGVGKPSRGPQEAGTDGGEENLSQARLSPASLLFDLSLRCSPKEGICKMQNA